MLNDLLLPTALETRTGPHTLRRADAADLDALMALLSDDPISSARGDVAADGDRDAYRAALDEIVADPANELLVVADAAGSVVATMQLTRIPGMARRGSTRLLVEAVRVGSALRSAGIGGAMMRWVTDDAAPALGSSLVQLTSDEARVDAHRFYERLGFVGSHRGFKYPVG
ncbi:GNAT family N-acetyltransferase [Microterricola pindariensis]|uniref:GNAT family N-acetyltransferase n=1 Tax=Microterricola pindariensis TaxID=478010 RepID=A0ABX5B256_9MICO|nr:GNAT family N-acetyltransferase [Microterricola pindariensis]PPL20479.1 GNAT family N-acetyltransferase [Microterricola pindariensis]